MYLTLLLRAQTLESYLLSVGFMQCALLCSLLQLIKNVCVCFSLFYFYDDNYYFSHMGVWYNNSILCSK